MVFINSRSDLYHHHVGSLGAPPGVVGVMDIFAAGQVHNRNTTKSSELHSGILCFPSQVPILRAFSALILCLTQKETVFPQIFCCPVYLLVGIILFTAQS